MICIGFQNQEFYRLFRDTGVFIVWTECIIKETIILPSRWFRKSTIDD